MYSVLCTLAWKFIPAAARSRLCSRVWAWAGIFVYICVCVCVCLCVCMCAYLCVCLCVNIVILFTILIYKALCSDVAQGRMNGAPNETQLTHVGLLV